MGWAPRLTVVCGRCGKPRGLAHVCVTSRPRKAPTRVKWQFPPCPDCHRKVDNPLTHRCRSKKGDWGRRRGVWEKQQKAWEKQQAKAARPAKPAHDYKTCGDPECRRPVCVAFKEGREIGSGEGYVRGWEARDSRGDNP
jgi:hypothetical protein